jgi:hypothetical protein
MQRRGEEGGLARSALGSDRVAAQGQVRERKNFSLFPNPFIISNSFESNSNLNV